MVCRNQSIDNSDAALARYLRVLLRERIATAAATVRFGISSSRAMATSSWGLANSPTTTFRAQVGRDACLSKTPGRKGRGGAEPT
jgi:hypothetical protein